MVKNNIVLYYEILVAFKINESKLEFIKIVRSSYSKITELIATNTLLAYSREL